MGKLTTHILDTARGKPGNNINISIQRIDNNTISELKSVITNDDGRVDGAVLEGDEFSQGQYQLVFQVGAYLSQFETYPNPMFLDEIVIRFGIADASEHFHVPLLLSPFGYTTYRGS